MYRAELSGIAGTSMEPYMRQRHHKVSKVWVVPTAHTIVRTGGTIL